MDEGINVPVPQTIADAIFVTNKLGLHHDSILSSFRADQGFLPDERPPDVLPYYIDKSRTPSHMMMEYEIPRQTPGFGKYETVVMHRPLEKCGWCLQESTLSPRRLIFQPPHLSYKCRSFIELDITRLSPFNRVFQEDQTAFPADDHIIFPTNKGTSNHEVDFEKFRERWRQVLLNYSGRQITAPSDKFVALAGVAEIFESISKDHDLFWQTWPPMGPDEALLPRPEGYRAPTWSWASVDSKLKLETFCPKTSDASYEGEIVECKVTPKSDLHPLGEIADAKLTLKVKMYPLMRNEIKGPPTEGPTNSNDEEERIRGIIFDSTEGTEPDISKDFYVVILRAGRQWGNQGDWMLGLIMVRVDGEVEQYRRIAKLDLLYHFQWPDWFDAAPLKTVTLV
ncbi:hypothetical protein CPB84DRAFT_1785632 [Gymnopilus junonius]|uniref:Uncharacterized protein n=1 Tax=Gymnopilus junonius TaxID=109634 RepID=A0A9P5TLG1_GYMJU|nr:hypothetical protein CPB84DRAFT_1785632 [Gymnopilus junonius]